MVFGFYSFLANFQRMIFYEYFILRYLNWETITPHLKEKANLEEEIKILHEVLQHYKYVPVSDLLQITVDVPDKRQMKIWENDVNKSINGFLSKENLMLPIRHEYQPKRWGGNTSNSKIYHENFAYLFSHRQKVGPLPNNSIRRISLVSAAREFSSFDRKIGDMRTHYESGQIKIGNVFSSPYEKTNFQKTAYEKELTFVALGNGAVGKGKIVTTNKVL